MNILYLPYEFPPFIVGGLGTYAGEMATRFTRIGHNVTVFTKNPGDLLTTDLCLGVEVNRPLLADISEVLPMMIPEDVKGWNPEGQKFFADVLMYNTLSASKVVNQLVRKDRRKFDLVVSHDWLSGIAGVVCSSSLQKPLVLHMHSSEKGRTGDGSPTIKAIEHKTADKAEIVITVSNAMVEELREQGFDEKKIRVVYNGVDPKKYDFKRFAEVAGEFRRGIGVKDNELMIFFVGRLTWVKGVDTLVKAMPVILKEVPNAKLVILGKGEMEGTVSQLVSSLGISNNVITHFKFVPEAERLLYYAACDVAVFPSRYEPFGIVCTEAMSMGKPVVVGAKGISGLKEQIIPRGGRRCGSHIDPDSPDDVAKFVVELLKDPQKRQHLGKNARKRVLENFTLDIIAEETTDIYREVVEGGKHIPQ
jgi:glycosyltransferase involved in cell wall biosynthesis